LQNVELLHYLALGRFLREEGLINGFQCNKFPRQSMYGQVDFSEGTLSHDLSNLVKLRGCCGWIHGLFECQAD